MGQPEMQAGTKRVKRRYVVLGIAVVAIVMLSILMVFFYTQALDYRNSKFKTQCASVEEIVSSMPRLSDKINETKDYTLDNGWRRSASLYAEATAESIASLCHVIGVAYAADDERALTFAALKTSFDDLADTLNVCYTDLTSQTRNISSDLSVSLSDSVEALTDMYPLISVGIDDSVDWMEEPYQAVSRMDLEALNDQADLLAAAQ
ncbi:MAG: hypothetical protein KKE24_06005 [Candidatus Thermoplasmatota archaeon]|nr:hypothetical protein [Candidatus Thermoplasmatota archaeon]